MVFSDEDKILIKSKKFVFEGVHTKEVDRRFPEKRLTKRGFNKLLKRCGTQAQFTGSQKFEFLISQGSVATRSPKVGG